MKNKKILNIVFLLIGIVMLYISMSMLQSTEKRWLSGIMIIASALIVGATAKSIANHYILRNYMEFKKQINKKENKKRENLVIQKSTSKSNLIVSVFLVVVIIFIFFMKLNYFILTILIIISIFMQSFLNAMLYIYYDKKIKENIEDK